MTSMSEQRERMPHLARSLNGYETAIMQAYAPMQVAPETPGHRYAWSVQGRRCGALGFTRIYARGAITARIPEVVSPHKRRDVVLTYVQQGAFEFEQGGRHAHCVPGSLVLMNTTRPLEATQDGIADLLSIVIPAEIVRAQLPAFERLCTTVVDASSGAPAVLRDLMQSCWRERWDLGSGAALAMPRAIVGLFEAVFGSAGNVVRVSRTRRDFRVAVREVIADELANPELTPALVAARLGISRSSLFALTRELGTTVRHLIIDTRLEAAAVALREPVWAAMTVTELALTFGFQDPAHFSRRFTARFGMPPREFRARRCVVRQEDPDTKQNMRKAAEPSYGKDSRFR